MSLGRGTEQSIGRGCSGTVASRIKIVCLGALAFLAATVTPVTLASARTTTPSPARAAGSCPWTSPAFDAAYTPLQLADMVIPRMSLTDKLDLLDLQAWKGYENRTTPIESLCIPAFTLQDGPDGIANDDTGVTQLPSSLGLAATFDTPLANKYGAVEGNEARRQGIDVVQGPNLNIDRVPQSGRAFEGYGEDPYLVSQMGVANIEGIQREGVMADAKHFTAYNQETDRINLNQVISERALEEMYLPPFEAAVVDANVASIMCSYGSINAVSDCGNPKLYHLLYKKWGFKGFVRSDLASVSNAPSAFAAGMDEIKPAAIAQLTESIVHGTLSMPRVDDAVARILSEMFTYGLIQHPIVGRLDVKVTNASHAKVALDVAERSMVLLKNRGGVLPLSARHEGTIAVIGTDASNGAMTAGFGSAHVNAPFRSTPLAAIRAMVGPKSKVVYAPGGASIGPEPTIAARLFKVKGSLTLSSRIAKRLRPARVRAMVGTGSFQSAESLLRHATATITVPTTGPYVFSLTSNGDAWLSVDGHQLISNPGLHAHSSWSAETTLTSGKRVVVALSWYPGLRTPMPIVGVRSSETPIEVAVAAARRANVAVVFANDISMEGTDRASLSLPSDENALIAAVAAVNHRTVVVLNTGGAVFMPWIAKVAGVVEGWYAGEEDGAAAAAVLFGKVDPSGHLPVTFPATTAQIPTRSRAAFPGNDGTVAYGEGLDVGYRYDQTNRLTPLFPFGYGLSYTSFAMSNLVVTSSTAGVTADVTVTNTGKRSGTEVAQAYLQFPPVAGEPPLQLKAFAPVTLAPGASAVVPLTLSPSSFEAYLTGGWQTVPGAYQLFVGDSSASLPLSATVAAPVAIAPASAASAASAAS